MCITYRTDEQTAVYYLKKNLNYGLIIYKVACISIHPHPSWIGIYVLNLHKKAKLFTNNLHNKL